MDFFIPNAKTMDGFHKEYFSIDEAFMDSYGNQYLCGWLKTATADDLANVGAQAMVVIGSPQVDQQFFDMVEKIEGHTITYTHVAKELAKLKAEAVSNVKVTTNSLLAPTDWQITASVDPSRATPRPIPEDVINYRYEVLSASSDAEEAINSAKNVEELIFAIQSVEWPS